MRVAYFDCFSGCSGNMILGALIDAGCPTEELIGYLRTLQLPGWELRIEAVRRNGFGATFVDVVQQSQAVLVAESEPEHAHPHDNGSDHTHPHDHHASHEHRHGPAHGQPPSENPTSRYLEPRPHQHARHLPEILEIIRRSGIPKNAKELASRIFVRLGEAEARVHRTTVEHVHFHEVGAVDAIVDIVGAAVALELLGIQEVFVSPINLGAGTVRAAHGTIPVPGPATAELLKGVPVYQSGPSVELTTPTGAAILSTLAMGFGPLPALTLDRIGYGAGSKELEIPNLLRVFIGERSAKSSDLEVDTVVVLEANVDDLSPQGWELVYERLFAAGALDVTLTPAQMKKQRPATLVSVIAPPDRAEEIAGVLLRETTTLGVRTYQAQRRCLPREIRTLETPYGPIRMKVASFGGMQRAMPEYDDCKRAAVAAGVPLREVQQAAEFAWRSEQREGT